MIGALSGLYAGLFKVDGPSICRTSRLASSYGALFRGQINEGCNAFIDGQGSVKQVRLPMSVYVYRVGGATCILSHNFMMVS